METSSVNDNITCSGALFYALDTKRFLFLQRTKNKTIGQWGLVGGMSERGETPWNSLQREIKEEIGVQGNFKKVIPLYEPISGTKDNFVIPGWVFISNK